MSAIAYPRITIPEFTLQQALQGMLTFIRTDYATNVAASTPDSSWLYKACLNQGFERYNFFDQAVQILCAPTDDPRYLTVELMFNMKRKGAPSIYINLPSEQTMPNGNGLGQDEDYFDYDQTEADPDEHIMATKFPILTRRYSAIYNIVVTSDNSNEVIFLFHFVKAMLTVLVPHLHFLNIQNVALGGQDIQPYNELANQLYMRAVSVSLQYDSSVPSIFPYEVPNGLVLPIDGIPVEPTD